MLLFFTFIFCFAHHVSLLVEPLDHNEYPIVYNQKAEELDLSIPHRFSFFIGFPFEKKQHYIDPQERYVLKLAQIQIYSLWDSPTLSLSFDARTIPLFNILNLQKNIPLTIDQPQGKIDVYKILFLLAIYLLIGLLILSISVLIGFIQLLFKKSFVGMYPILFCIFLFQFLFDIIDLFTFNTSSYNMFKEFQNDSAYLVIASIKTAITEGVFSPLGSVEMGFYYFQQFGLQGKFLQALVLFLGIKNSDTAIFIGECINSILLAGIFVAILHWIRLQWGQKTMAFVFFILLFSVWEVYMARNLYWCLWSFFLPFVFVSYYFKNRPLRINPYFVAVLTLLYLIKFLMGMEFASTIVLASFTPFVYYFISQNNIYSLRSVLQLSYYLLGFIGISLLAFLIAGSITLTQTYFYLQDWQDVLNHAVGFVSNRVSGLNPTEHTSYFLVLLNYLFFKPLFIFTNNTVDFNNIFSINMGWLFCLQFFFMYRFRQLILENKKLQTIAMLSILALLAPLSWYILAKPHSVIHIHINAVLWSVPSLLWMGIFFVYLYEVSKFKTTKLIQK